MSKYLQTYTVNYSLSSMGDTTHFLEKYVDEHLEKNLELKVKQVEMLWGNTYGARIAVVYEESKQEGEPTHE